MLNGGKSSPLATTFIRDGDDNVGKQHIRSDPCRRRTCTNQHPRRTNITHIKRVEQFTILHEDCYSSLRHPDSWISAPLRDKDFLWQIFTLIFPIYFSQNLAAIYYEKVEKFR